MPKLCGLKQAATERIATRALGVTAPLMTLPHVSCGASRPLARICALRRSSHITTIAANASYTSLPLFAHGTTDFSRRHASARCGDLHITTMAANASYVFLPLFAHGNNHVSLHHFAGTHLRAAVKLMSLYVISLARICAPR